MVTIYNVATGEPKTLDMVDAREHVASGRWGFERQEPVPVVDTTSAEPVPVVDTTSAEAYDERLEAFNAAMQTAEATPQVQAVAKARKSKK